MRPLASGYGLATYATASPTKVRCRCSSRTRTVLAMTRTSPEGLHPKASVTVEAAAALVDVDTGTIRAWSRSGSIELEVRGDMEVVRLDQVRAVAAGRARHRPRGAALRERLDGARLPSTLSVTDLQALARG